MILTFKDFYTNLSSSIRSTIFITLVLLIIIIIVSIRLKKYDHTQEPRGIVIILEWLISGVNGMCKEMMGKHYRKMAPYITTIAIFLFISNISGLFGLTPPTASVSVTLTLGLMTFTLIQFAGIRYGGLWSYIKGYFSPNPIFLPINLIGEVATPFSLGLRLFGNVLSGTVIMALVYSVLGWMAVGVAPVLHLYFDIFSGFIQTLVFCTLTTVFISGKMPDEDTEYFEKNEEVI